MQGWLQERLFHAEPDPARAALLHRHPAAQRHRQAAHGPRPERLDPGRAHALPPHAGRERLLAGGHRPRRHRHAERGGEDAARGGPHQGRPGARGVRRARVGVAPRVRRHHHRASSRRLGCACDYERERFTFDEGYAQAVTHVFVALYEKGYIYKDSLPRQLVPALRHGHQRPRGGLPRRCRARSTTSATPVDGGGSLTIATTRPGDHAGRHRRGREPGRRALQGPRRARPPCCRCWGATLRIVADERVDPSFGTGALKITPAHDLTDFDIGRDPRPGGHPGHRPGRPHHRRRRSLRRPGGRGGGASAWSPTCARSACSRRSRTTPHSVATCDRCGTPIEPLISEQWFMRMDELKQPATEAVRDGARDVHARTLGPGLPGLDGEPAALVHQRASSGGATSCRCGTAAGAAPHHRGRGRAAGLRHVRRHELYAARPTCWTPGSARRCGRSPPGAGRERTADLEYFYPDGRAQHGARDHLPVGRAHGHDGPRVHGRHPLPATSTSTP